MSRFLIRLRLILGGAICGTFLGLLFGALSGAAYGAHVGNHSFGLRGAFGGGVIFCGVGLLYGGFLRPPRMSDPSPKRDLKHASAKDR